MCSKYTNPVFPLSQIKMWNWLSWVQTYSTIAIIIIIITVFIIHSFVCEFFTAALADGFSLEFEG